MGDSMVRCCATVECEDARGGLLHQISSARIMSGKLAENMLRLFRQLTKRPHEGTEVASPRHVLASNDLSEPSRTSSGLALIAEVMGRTGINRS